MHYRWDETKADRNIRKHGIHFADAVSIFADERAITIEDYYRDEERYVTLGLDAFGRLLVVIYTFRGDTVRIISARKATRASDNNTRMRTFD